MKENKPCICLLILFLSFALGMGPAAQTAAGGEPLDTLSTANTRKISMDFEGAAVKDVLKIFSQQSGLNFVANEEIESKKVTIYFENVDVKDALDSIMSANNLRYEQAEGSNIFVVYSADSAVQKLTTKVFHLKYMRLSVSPLDVGGQRTVTDLLKSDIPTSSTQETGGTSSGTSSTSTASSGTAGQSTTVRGVDQLASSLLSPRGKITLDIHTNSLIVTDTEEKLKAIEQVLSQIDVPPPQVVLEVYVMEVKKDLLENEGIEWGGTNGALFSANGAQLTTGYPFTSGLFKKGLHIDVKNPAFFGLTPSRADTAGGLTTGLLNANALSATLHFIKTQTDTKILAEPRVLTQNNEAATIKLVTNAAISANTTLTTAGTLTSSTTDVVRAQLGISLKMTPQINENNSVDLFLEPSVTTAQPSSFFAGNVILDPTTRIVRTIVRVENDQTLVIGGLIDNNDISAKRKIPFLGDVPVIGKPFQYDNRNNGDREILIFITPHIIPSHLSASKGNPISFQKDAAARQMLDRFSNEEMEKIMGSFDDQEKMKTPLLQHQKEFIQTTTQRSLDPMLDKEMNTALSSFDLKTPKTNR